MSTFDWGAGRYEETAARLEPAARVIVERAAPAAGEHVVDVGCGTGNAALLAAERGATVTGVDPAPRLLEVARGRPRHAGSRRRSRWARPPRSRSRTARPTSCCRCSA